MIKVVFNQKTNKSIIFSFLGVKIWFHLELCLCFQLSMYKERYEEFQSTIKKSEEMFQKFKTEMDKVISTCLTLKPFPNDKF